MNSISKDQRLREERRGAGGDKAGKAITSNAVLSEG